ncbi:hypothetical protein CVT24_005512 [Panaeolus cyanescens]|uniref:Protein kinase domain-containing protein n=1 Tax=Panaeolus cyanescens TaxID=181874 RepID=A0A409YC05_9AGAR|nr:hypothetical protein CVT24_005512 [Panaeolus cyanescens]
MKYALITFGIGGTAIALIEVFNRRAHLQQFVDALKWKLRALLHAHPLPRNLTGWNPAPSTKDNDVWEQETRRVYSYWMYLQPFFKTKGYLIFEPMNDSQWFQLIPARFEHPTPSKRRSDYPYSRKGYTDDKSLQFTYFSTRVWPARDFDGNEVVIRIVSDKEPSEELLIWRRLDSPTLRNHARNRTIPVLEYLEFDGLIFIVMPWWSSPGQNDFATCAEVLNMADYVLDYVDFLHEHRIVHRDLDVRNMGLNIVNNGTLDYPKGNHNPDEALYAFMDFGFSLIYPYETQLDGVTTTLRYGWEIEDVHPERNPFKLEVHCVVERLQFYVRVVEKHIPQIGPFFDDIVNAEEAERPFAREVLQRFRQMKASLTPEQLNAQLQDRYWLDGKFKAKR